MTWKRTALTRLGLATLGGLSLLGCADETCKPTAVTVCLEGEVYWVDSCSKPSELKETCPAGCSLDATGCAACLPACAGRCGGPDGCGFSCPNTCGPREYCSQASGFTACDSGCSPACTGKCGGPDLCGGTCPATCGPSESCTAASGYSVCGPLCTPDCAGRDCGDDGCGGSCGACQGGQYCQAGVCAWVCDPSTCPAGCCDGTSCLPGDTRDACGRGGGACLECLGQQTCVDGACDAPVDPCGGVPMTGRCLDSAHLQVCLDLGGGQLRVETYPCSPGSECRLDGDRAGCVQTAECLGSETACLDANTLGRCQDMAWDTTPCPAGCVDSPIGSACTPEGEWVTRTLTFQYETRSPNDGWTDWGEPWLAPAMFFLVTSWTLTDAGSTMHDSQVTDAAGTVTVTVPGNAGPDEWIVVFAAGLRADGGLAFVVADPDLGAGTATIGSLGADPRIWQWAVPAEGLSTTSAWTIPTSSGSGAARVFDYLRYVYRISESRWSGEAPGPLVVWLGMDVGWSCGSCFAGWPVTEFGLDFDSQVWMSGDADQGYWSDAVTTHELGHWTMSSFGYPAVEGGRHCIGVPTLPGQAWSEGWATWFSSDARGSPYYYDKQGGGFFWWSLDTRDYSGGTLWQRPSPYHGLMQLMDENEVAAELWALSAAQGLTRAPLDAAMASERMTDAPFARGYRRHTWDVDAACQQTNVQETGTSAPFLADFLDALRCGGVSAVTVDAATQPDQHYPYPSGSPLCGKRAEAPFALAWRVARGAPAAGAELGLELVLERRGRWPAPLQVRFELPAGVEAPRGNPGFALPADDQAPRRALGLELRLARVPERDLVAVVDARVPGAGYHAELPYRFGRPEPRRASALELGPRVALGARDFGRAVLLRR
ncbi:MAG TPA: hypothetical protein PK668_21520 [Myxococcota bacterium]|nr:hypothetical protein [Myxococcota bacterium]HRY96057.1 hypothetical protein [Myxococcota bacterium]HSA23303.1 hypothetical protein [Myxococcota bacterium]